MPPVFSKEMHRVSISSSVSSSGREPVPKVRENSAILKRAMTERRTRWSGRDWNSKPKSHWRWKEPVKAHTISGSVRNLEANGKISGKIDALGSAFKKMSNTRIKSCKESAKRINIFQEGTTRRDRRKTRGQRKNIIKKTLTQLRKDEEEANEARTLLDEMQRNVDEADAKITETRSRLYRETTEDMHSWDQELGRPHHVMKRMTEPLKLNGNYAVYLESTYRRGKRNWGSPHHVLD